MIATGDNGGVDGLLLRAFAATEQGHLAEAIEVYREVLAREPDHPLARNNLGCLLIDQNRAREAFRLFAGPDDDPSIIGNNLGYALFEAGDLGRAEQVFNDLLRLDAENATARNHRAMIWLRCGRVDEAIGELLRVVRERPRSLEAWNNLGCAHWKRVDLARARESFEVALRVDPYNVDAHNNLGCVLRELSEPEEALEEFKLAVQLDPSDPQIQLNLALTYRQLGDGRRARSHLHRHLELQTGDPSSEIVALRQELETL